MKSIFIILSQASIEYNFEEKLTHPRFSQYLQFSHEDTSLLCIWYVQHSDEIVYDLNKYFSLMNDYYCIDL